MSLGPGTTLGRYLIESPLGAGGMGDVYLAEDTGLHRRVALKLLSGALAADDTARKRLVREAQAAAAPCRCRYLVPLRIAGAPSTARGCE